MGAWVGGAAIGVGNGIAREATYGKRLSEPGANRLSALTAIAAFVLYFRALQRRWPLDGGVEASRVGAAWLALTVCFESALGRMLSLIVPLALGYLAVRAVASGLSGAAESGRLDVLLSAPVSRSRLVAASFAATAVELAIVLVLTVILTGLGSLVSGADLSLGSAFVGYANVWPLALVFAGLGVIATGFSLRTSVVTGAVAGVLVTMYVIDLIGKLDPGLSGIRYASVFKYYGNAIEDGIEPIAFIGVTAAAIIFAAVGAWLFERRDLSA